MVGSFSLKARVTPAPEAASDVRTCAPARLPTRKTGLTPGGSPEMASRKAADLRLKDRIVNVASMSGSRRPTLMIVHAHPDDEASQTGGTLARYAAAGFRTVLVTCTDGSQGDGVDGCKPGQPNHRPEEVAELRSRELQKSKAALNITDVIELGFPDSGTSEATQAIGPHAFSRLDGEPIVRRLEELMREYEPDVVVTYPPNGISYHPDHVRTHEVTFAAVENVRASGGFRPDGLLPKFYYIVLSVSRLKAARTRAEASLGTGVWTPPLEIGVDDEIVTTRVDISNFWSEKLESLAAHASQADAAALYRVLSLAGSENSAEEYVRVIPPWTGGEREDDLFQDILGKDDAGTPRHCRSATS